MKAEAVIKKRIEESGLKLRHVAQESNIPPDKLSRGLNGYRKLTPDEFVRVCQTLEIDFSYFRESA